MKIVVTKALLSNRDLDTAIRNGIRFAINMTF